MSGGFFRGTSTDQDSRFSNKNAKLLKSQKFPAGLDEPVFISKVDMDVLKPWIAKRVTELVGMEDEVLINYIYGLLEGKKIDGKQVHVQLTGFLEKNTSKFMRELWALLLSAQKHPLGIPQKFIDDKANEEKKKEESVLSKEEEEEKKRATLQGIEDARVKAAQAVAKINAVVLGVTKVPVLPTPVPAEQPVVDSTAGTAPVEQGGKKIENVLTSAATATPAGKLSPDSSKPALSGLTDKESDEKSAGAASMGKANDDDQKLKGLNEEKPPASVPSKLSLSAVETSRRTARGSRSSSRSPRASAASPRRNRRPLSPSPSRDRESERERDDRRWRLHQPPYRKRSRSPADRYEGDNYGRRDRNERMGRDERDRGGRRGRGRGGGGEDYNYRGFDADYVRRYHEQRNVRMRQYSPHRSYEYERERRRDRENEKERGRDDREREWDREKGYYERTREKGGRDLRGEEVESRERQRREKKVDDVTAKEEKGSEGEGGVKSGNKREVGEKGENKNVDGVEEGIEEEMERERYWKEEEEEARDSDTALRGRDSKRHDTGSEGEEEGLSEKKRVEGSYSVKQIGEEEEGDEERGREESGRLRGERQEEEEASLTDEQRKALKRKRKEEKRARKEERRKKREERRRRKEEKEKKKAVKHGKFAVEERGERKSEEREDEEGSEGEGLSSGESEGEKRVGERVKRDKKAVLSLSGDEEKVGSEGEDEKEKERNLQRLEDELRLKAMQSLKLRSKPNA